MTIGVNYPWRQYGGDFGPTVWGTHQGVTSAAVEVSADLHQMATAGVQVVRWFVYTDARGGVCIDRDGWPVGLHEGAVADFDTLLLLALEAGVQVVPVLFDHTLAFRPTAHAGASVGGHGRWLGELTGQTRLLEAVIAPLAKRYGAGGSHSHLGAAIYAWDLLNEPDWLVAELSPSRRVEVPVSFDVLSAWIHAAVGEFRRREAGRVTLGTARLRFAAWWDDDRLDLDFLQVHAYFDPDYDLDLLRTPHAALGVRRPVIVGECSARGEVEVPAHGRPALSVADLVCAVDRLGYAGAWPWSWRGVDAHGPVDADAFRVALKQAAPATEP